MCGELSEFVGRKAKLEKQKIGLEKQIGSINDDLSAIKKVEEFLAQRENASVEHYADLSSDLRYRDISLYNACLDVLNKADSELLVSGVTQIIESGGFPFTTKRHDLSVHGVLRRLDQDGKIEIIKKGTRRSAYKIRKVAEVPSLVNSEENNVLVENQEKTRAGTILDMLEEAK